MLFYWFYNRNNHQNTKNLEALLGFLFSHLDFANFTEMWLIFRIQMASGYYQKVTWEPSYISQTHILYCVLMKWVRPLYSDGDQFLPSLFKNVKCTYIPCMPAQMTSIPISSRKSYLFSKNFDILFFPYQILGRTSQYRIFLGSPLWRAPSGWVVFLSAWRRPVMPPNT